MAVKASEVRLESRGRLGVWAAAIVFGVVMLLALPSGAAAAEGDLDLSFGSGGIATALVGTGHSSFTFAAGVALQPDGNVVLGGTASLPSGRTGFALARFTTNGSLDSSFGSGGVVLTDLGDDSGLLARVVLQPDGKLVMAGSTQPSGGNGEMVIARYEADGALDTSFGGGDGLVSVARTGYQDGANDLAIQSDGKIVIVGSEVELPIPGSLPTPGSSNFLIVRLASDGSLDTSFGSAGRALVDLETGKDDIAYSVALDSAGRIVAAGSSQPGGFAVVRLLSSNGSPDPSFGPNHNGIFRDAYNGGSTAIDVVVQSNGKILTFGDASGGGFAILHLHPDGTKDNAFGGNQLNPVPGDPGPFRDGISITLREIGGTAFSAEVMPDGRVVVGGVGGDVQSLVAARYLSDGTLDPTFGTGGYVVSDPLGRGGWGMGIVVQSDGRILLGGIAFESPPCTGTGAPGDPMICFQDIAKFAVARYAAASAPPPGLVTRAGTRLLLGGQPFRPIGLNVYNANSNGWCSYAMGGSVLDDSLTSMGAGKNAVRSWFFQQLATTAGSRDWTAFDNTLRAARAHGYKVIATLTDQWGDCGVSYIAGYGYKNTNWYQNAYKERDPSGTVSYRDWVAEVVARYKTDPTILAWQLVNEPEVLPFKDADCATVPESVAASTLSAFTTDVSGLIKAIDPYHLVSLGTIGSGQCGAQENDFESLMSIPSLDLCEFHDYIPNQLVPGDVYNGLQRRLDQCNALNKPLLIGEEGVDLNPLGGVTPTAISRRATIFSDKLCAQFTAGVAGGLLWAWNKNGPSADPNNPVYDIGPGDPALDVLTPWADPTHTCSAASAPRNVVAAPGDESASVSWLAPVSDGGSAISSYIVTSNPGGLTATVNGSVTTTSVAGLNNGTAYTFTIVAANGSGTSSPSVASNSATPQGGNTAATAIAPSTSSTTVTTGIDPAAIGGIATAITVPAGTGGGPVFVTQTATNQAAPTGYVFGSVQVDIAAPAATVSNPLALVFTMTPPAGAPLDQTTLGATNIYRAEGTGTPALIPDCGTPVDLALFNPCLSNREYVTINGVVYIKVSVLTSTASRWNSARPRPGAVVVSDSGYTPATVTIQPGASVLWKFSGKKAHTVTDTIGLGASGASLFKSAALTSGSYSFTFPAAGSYPYKSTVKGDSISGTVAIPAAITPSSGSASTNFSVIWATNTPASYVFDVQYRFKPVGATGWKNWAAWKTGTVATHAAFMPNQGAGAYAFHTRLRNTNSGRASLYSPDITISVS